MPRLNGLQATQRIRAEFPDVRIIMITLHDSEEMQAASISAGADRFIPKNRLHDELPGVIAQLFPCHAGNAERRGTPGVGCGSADPLVGPIVEP